MDLKRKMRKEFAILIDRCGCSRAGLDGRCTPRLCFPTTYKFLYPKGGFAKKSDMARRRKKILDLMPTEKKCPKCGRELLDGKCFGCPQI